MTSVQTYDGEAEALEGDLAQHSEIDGIEVQADRRPHRLLMWFTDEQDTVPEGVRDILEQHQATIEDVGHADGPHWWVQVRPTERWMPAGQRMVRAHGGSIVVTLSREAIEASGLRESEDVDLAAREGQVRITRRADE